MRKTIIRDISIFLSAKTWRATIEIFSTTGEDDKSFNFTARINAPILNFDKSPDQIKNEIYKTLIQAFEEVHKEISSIKFEDFNIE